MDVQGAIAARAFDPQRREEVRWFSGSADPRGRHGRLDHAPARRGHRLSSRREPRPDGTTRAQETSIDRRAAPTARRTRQSDRTTGAHRRRVARHPRHDPPLAPATGCPEVDVQASIPWPTSGHGDHRRPGRPQWLGRIVDGDTRESKERSRTLVIESGAPRSATSWRRTESTPLPSGASERRGANSSRPTGMVSSRSTCSS